MTITFDPTAIGVDVTDTLRVTLADGREVAAPLAWFPRLLNATPKQRQNWRLIGRGAGIYWSDIDEDVFVRGLLGLADPMTCPPLDIGAELARIDRQQAEIHKAVAKVDRWLIPLTVVVAGLSGAVVGTMIWLPVILQMFEADR